MSDKTFYFPPEEPVVCNEDKKRDKKDIVFATAVAAVIGITAVVLLSSIFLSKKNISRQPAQERSQDKTDTSVHSTEIIPIDPLYIRIKDGSDFRVAKINMTLEVKGAHEEIENSLHSIRNHLIFILSRQSDEVFKNHQKKQLLKQEIIHQINLFLSKAQVEKVELNEDFLI